MAAKGHRAENPCKISHEARRIYLQAGVSHAMPPANLSYIEPQGRERRLCGGIRGRGRGLGWKAETPPPPGCHGGVMDGRPDLGLTEPLASQAAPVGDGVSGNMPSGIDMKDAKRQSLAVRGILAPKKG